jgi:hypothetical protein
MTKLVEPDLNRCQGEYKSGFFMILGSGQWIRCNNGPKYIAFENQPGPDGLQGSMSLCEECAEVLKKNYGEKFATLHKIVKVKQPRPIRSSRKLQSQ